MNESDTTTEQDELKRKYDNAHGALQAVRDTLELYQRDANINVTKIVGRKRTYTEMWEEDPTSLVIALIIMTVGISTLGYFFLDGIQFVGRYFFGG